MIKAAIKLLADPAALLLMLAAGLASGSVGLTYGWLKGEAGATAACNAATLQKQLDEVTAQRNLVQGRLDLLTRLTQSDATRAAVGAQADRTNKEMVRATPDSHRACLDPAAARRLRKIH